MECLYDVIGYEDGKKFIRRRIYYLLNKPKRNEDFVYCLVHFLYEGILIEEGNRFDFNLDTVREAGAGIGDKDQQGKLLIGNKIKRSIEVNSNKKLKINGKEFNNKSTKLFI